MKTCEKCKAEFYKWDDTKVSDKYCVQCVVLVYYFGRTGDAGKTH